MRSVESLGCSLFRLRPSELSRSAYTWQNGHAPQWHELQAVPLVGWHDALQCCGLDAPHSGSSAVATAVPGAAAASAHVAHAQHAQNSQCFASAPHQFAQPANAVSSASPTEVHAAPMRSGMTSSAEASGATNRSSSAQMDAIACGERATQATMLNTLRTTIEPARDASYPS